MFQEAKLESPSFIQRGDLKIVECWKRGTYSHEPRLPALYICRSCCMTFAMHGNRPEERCQQEGRVLSLPIVRSRMMSLEARSAALRLSARSLARSNPTPVTTSSLPSLFRPTDRPTDRSVPLRSAPLRSPSSRRCCRDWHPRDPAAKRGGRPDHPLAERPTNRPTDRPPDQPQSRTYAVRRADGHIPSSQTPHAYVF